MVIQDQTTVGEEEILIKHLYVILMKNNLGNAKYCKTLIKHKLIKVNNEICDNPIYPIYGHEVIEYNNNILSSQPFHYYMLNKPAGYLSANHDKKYPCVLDLIDNKDCYCLGRLDIDTTGLLILTDDKSLSKKLLLPQNHVEKTYLVGVDHKLDNDLKYKFYEGVLIDNQIQTKSAIYENISETSCLVTISEGKYHQIKKMFLSCGYRVISLKRIKFASINLDENLKEGDYRSLTNDEIMKLNGL